MKVQLSDLAEMDAEERGQVYDDIMRTSARPEQLTSLQRPAVTVPHDGIRNAFSQLRSGNTDCLLLTDTRSIGRAIAHQ